MSISVFSHDRISMSQKEHDVLTIIHAVLRGERTQTEAARLLDKGTRQLRRILRRLQVGGDAALVHGLRGKPSNPKPDPKLRQAVLAAYRPHSAEFGPTFASEKLAEHGLHAAAQTLRRWLIAEGQASRIAIHQFVAMVQFTIRRQFKRILLSSRQIPDTATQENSIFIRQFLRHGIV